MAHWQTAALSARTSASLLDQDVPGAALHHSAAPLAPLTGQPAVLPEFRRSNRPNTHQRHVHGALFSGALFQSHRTISGVELDPNYQPFDYLDWGHPAHPASAETYPLRNVSRTQTSARSKERLESNPQPPESPPDPLIPQFSIDKPPTQSQTRGEHIRADPGQIRRADAGVSLKEPTVLILSS